MFNCLGSTGTLKGIASGSQLYIFSRGGSRASFNSSLVNFTLLAPIGGWGVEVPELPLAGVVVEDTVVVLLW